MLHAFRIKKILNQTQHVLHLTPSISNSFYYYRDMNLPKFVFDDVPLFLGLISDLFPGLKCHRVTYPEFSKAVEDEILNKSYILLENQVNKKN